MKLSAVFSVIVLTVASSLTTMAQPKLNVVEGLSFEFGEVYTSHPVKKTITLRNEGTDTLVISNVSTTCGCTAGLLSNDHILPNESGLLEISFDGSRFSGKVARAVSFETNDTNNRKIHINFTANVEKVLTVQPDYLFYNRVSIDTAATLEVTIENETDNTICIESVKPSSEMMTVQISEKKIKGGEEVKLTCILLAKEPGTIKGNIEIKTDSHKVPILNLRYFAFAKGNQAQPTTKQN